MWSSFATTKLIFILACDYLHACARGKVISHVVVVVVIVIHKKSTDLEI